MKSPRTGDFHPWTGRSRWTTRQAGRIAGEAGVLAGLNDPRLVRLVEGSVEVGGRKALVLESAGEETLGEVLRSWERLSLDLLERWGTDLLEALVSLDRSGWTTGMSSRPTWGSGRAAVTGPSTWSCSTPPCPVRARPR